MKAVTTTYEGYLDWRAQAPWGPCGPLGEPPVFLIPTSGVRATAPRTPPIIAPRTLARPAARFASGRRFTTLGRGRSRVIATSAVTSSPPKCVCGGYVTPGPWSTCNNCRRIRQWTPAEQAAHFRLRLALALGGA